MTNPSMSAIKVLVYRTGDLEVSGIEYPTHSIQTGNMVATLSAIQQDGMEAVDSRLAINARILNPKTENRVSQETLTCNYLTLRNSKPYVITAHSTGALYNNPGLPAVPR